MSNFRCYSCWRSLGFSGLKDYLVCSGCDAQLWVKPTVGDVLSETSRSEYNDLEKKLHETLAADKEIYKGNIEAIAGPDSQFMPDAIYYRRGELFLQKPLIYGIMPGEVLNSTATIAKYRLFSLTAQYLFTRFYLVVSRDNQGISGEEGIREMLKKNGIDDRGVHIIAL